MAGDLERLGPREQREKPRHMARYLPILVASLPWSGHFLNITSQLKPTEGLHDKKGVESRRPVPSVETIWGLLRSGFHPFEWRGWG